MKIKVLNDKVINQIAAGEVVDRPASVVRELVDNAIDAGATKISIFLEQGGRSLIRVIDNGSGMERDDALLAFERHATSKVTTSEDLATIASLGFRGEALASIASVARVTLLTAILGGSGTKVSVEGGSVREVSAVVTPIGTDISVKNLFFNTPARRKFLRSPNTEEERVRLWVAQSALAWPTIHYRLVCDSRELLNLPPRTDLLTRASALIRGATVAVSGGFETTDGAGSIVGLIGHPSQATTSVGNLAILINRRLVSDKLIMRAIRDGFFSTLKAGESPIGFLNVEIPPQSVDVNVHPQKSEVRFRDPQVIFQAVRLAIQSSVQEFRSPMAGREFNNNSRFISSGTPSPGDHAHQSTFNLVVRGYDVDGGAALAPMNSSAQPIGDVESGNWLGLRVNEAIHLDHLKGAQGVTEQFRFSNLRYLGQIMGCYLICEHQEKLVVVDMHAAHERYNFNLIRNRFRNRNESGTAPQQNLLTPITVVLGDAGRNHLLEHSELFAQFGFVIEGFGPDGNDATIVVRAAPPELKVDKIAKLMTEFAQYRFDGGEDMRSPQPLLEERLDHICARLACHASIRGGDIVNRDQVYRLFSALDSTEFSAACPHGRPVIVQFDKGTVERWFGRDR